MEKYSRHLLDNYRIAMRYEMNALGKVGMGVEYYLDHLGKLKTLAENCASKVAINERQMVLDV